jgi:ATP-dependent DNA helicase RecG
MTKDKLNPEAYKRIKTMVKTSDGFEIAEVDLKLRGPGDLHGTQQSGILDLKIADIVKDEKILKYAREKAIELLNDDPHLEKESNSSILKELNKLSKNRPNWSLIS